MAREEKNMHRVMIEPAGYDSCRKVVDRAFELFSLEIAGKKVLIKPNVLRATEAKEHVVTNPAVLRAVVEKVEEMKPAEIIVGDNPGLFNTATMMGLDPSRLRFLQKAKAMGLGDYDLACINIHGKLTMLSDFKLPPLGGQAIASNEAVQEFMLKRSFVKPLPDPDLCTACGACIDQCPVSALSMKDNLPEADPDICITCFCCQEICPEKAMSLK
jgi:heterodisulfide reductase subunit A-like polyferredoxin